MTRKPKHDKTKKDDVSQVIRDISVGDISNINGGVINVGSGNVQTGSTIDARIDTGGGAYIGGNVSLGGGSFIARDQINYASPSNELQAQFEEVIKQIRELTNIDSLDREDMEVAVREVEKEVAKGKELDENFLARRLRNIGRIAPDILEVVLATITSPAAGLGVVAKKIAERARTGAA